MCAWCGALSKYRVELLPSPSSGEAEASGRGNCGVGNFQVHIQPQARAKLALGDPRPRNGRFLAPSRFKYPPQACWSGRYSERHREALVHTLVFPPDSERKTPYLAPQAGPFLPTSHEATVSRLCRRTCSCPSSGTTGPAPSACSQRSKDAPWTNWPFAGRVFPTSARLPPPCEEALAANQSSINGLIEQIEARSTICRKTTGPRNHDPPHLGSPPLNWPGSTPTSVINACQ